MNLREEELSMATISPVTAAADTAASAAQAPTADKKAQDQKTQFLTLLVAQLKGQNPLNPLDGTQFVSQLAQFSSLEQLVAIHTTLEGMKNQSATPPAAPETSDAATETEPEQEKEQ